MNAQAKSIEKTQKAPESSSPSRAFARQPDVGLSAVGCDATSVPQMAGNLAVQQLFRAGGIQAKLEISQPGDPDEEEADRVADQVMRMAELAPIGSAPRAIQRKCSACEAGGVTCPKCEEEQKIQRKEKPGHAPQSTPAINSQIATLRGGGQQLPPSVRAFFEPRFGRDLSQVRVHTDGQAAESARAIHARAFTAGQDVVFDAGGYSPESLDGRKLLAHELTHIAQQGAASFVPAVIQRQPATQSLPTGASAPASVPDADGPPGIKLVKPPEPKGELVVHTGTNVTFTDNPEYVRYQLEVFLADKGLPRIGIFESKDELYQFGTGLGPFLNPAPKPLTPEREAYLKRVVQVVHQEVKSIRFWIDDFHNEFQRRAVDTVWDILNRSKEEVEKERDRYGIKEEAKTFLGVRYGTRHTMAQNKESGDLVDAANALLTKQRTVMSAWNELQSLPVDPALIAPSPDGTPQKRNEALRKQEAGVRVKLDAAEKEYNMLRNEQEGLHPILVTYRLEAFSPDTGTILAKLASGSSESRAAALGSEITEKLENIEKVRKNVSDDRALVWKLPYIVDATKQLPDIRDYKHLSMPLASATISEKVAGVKANEEILHMALGVVGIGLALLASLPTGGLSLAAATGVAAAGTAGRVLGVALAIRAYQKYEFDSATTGTSFDKAKAISQDEPSLFWLALDILGAAAVSAQGALAAFRRLATLRKLALIKQATRVGEAAGIAELKAVEQEGNAIKQGLGDKLRQEIVGHAQSPKQFPWRPNPDGPRTIEEAIAIARKRGISIPQDVHFAVSKTPLPSNRFAEYVQLGAKHPEEIITWEQFYNRFEQIPVRLSAEVLNSDEAIVAVMAHEMHELNSLRELFKQAGNKMKAGRLHQLIREGVPGNLHDQAWDVADAMVTKMRTP